MTPDMPFNDCTDANQCYDRYQLRALLDALPVLIAYVNDRQCYCFSNLAHQLWFGYSPREIAGMRMQEVLGEAAYASLQPYIEQALHGKQVKFELVVPYKRIGPKHICASYVPDRREDGRIQGFFALISDISELRQLDAQRSRHLKETTHTARLNLMGELTSQIVHQVSQPLAAIVSYAEACARMLQSGEAHPEELAGVLTEIAGEAQRAGELIHEIRSFISKHEPRIRPIDINELVRETIHLVELDPNWGHLQIHLESDRSEPRVRGDPVMIEQVILNLVHNGLEAMEAIPAAQRRLCLRTQAYANQTVEVSVEDRGTGLNPTARKHLFEPFTTTKQHGMGMGLAISQSIIKRHGGNLWATDNPSGGSTFHFTLPKSNPDATHPRRA